MPQREGYENSLLFVISLSLVFTICVALLRLWIRKSAYGVDDVVIGAATLVSLGHTGADYAAMSYGLGKTWPSIRQQGDLAQLNEVGTGEDVDRALMLIESRRPQLLVSCCSSSRFTLQNAPCCPSSRASQRHPRRYCCTKAAMSLWESWDSFRSWP